MSFVIKLSHKTQNVFIKLTSRFTSLWFKERDYNNKYEANGEKGI